MTYIVLILKKVMKLHGYPDWEALSFFFVNGNIYALALGVM